MTTSGTVTVPKKNTIQTAGLVSSVVNRDFLQAFVVTSSSNNNIRIVTSRSTKRFSQAGGDANQLAPWKSADLKGAVYNEAGTAETGEATDPANLSPVSFTTAKYVSSVVVGEATYFFWIEKATSVLCAGRIDPAASPSKVLWAEILNLSNGGTASNFIVSANGVSATMGGSTDEILVSFPVAAPLAGNNTIWIQYLVLNPAKMNVSANTWQVETSFSPQYFNATAPLPASQTALGQSNSALVGSLPNTTLSSWIVRQASSTDPTGTSAMYVFSLYNNSTHMATTGFYPLTGSCRPTSAAMQQCTMLNWPSSAPSTPNKGCYLKGDPAGRPVLFYSDSNKVNNMATLNVMQPLNSSSVWEGFTPLTDQYGNQQQSGYPYHGTYIITPAYNGTAGNRDMDVYLSQFYAGTGDNTPLQFCAKKVGQLAISSQTVPAASTVQGKAVPTLIGDPFPMPMPATYLWQNGSPDGMADWNVFAYEYMVSEESNSSLDVEFTAALGMNLKVEAGFIVTSKHALELVLGGGYSYNYSQSKFEAKSYKVLTKSQPNPYYSDDGSAAAPYIIRPYGGYSARLLPSVRVDSYTYSEYVGTSLNPVTGLKAPTMTTLMPLINESGSELRNGDYFVYTGNPGDMNSFTQASINARMQALYQQLQSQPTFNTTIKSDFSSSQANPNGDLLKYYQNGTYLQQVIADFAVPLNRNGDKCLSFSMSGSSFSDSQFKSTSSVTNAGKFFMNFSYYGGVSFGTAVEANVGVEIAFNIAKSITETKSWGLGCQSFLDTMASGQSLTVEMYLLGASRLWAAELKYFPQLAQRMYLTALPDISQAPASTSADTTGLEYTLNQNGLELTSALPQRLLFVVTSWDDGSSSSNQ